MNQHTLAPTCRGRDSVHVLPPKAAGGHGHANSGYDLISNASAAVVDPDPVETLGEAATPHACVIPSRVGASHRAKPLVSIFSGQVLAYLL